MMITGTITGFYNGCPKPDGWFGGYIKTATQKMRITGVWDRDIASLVPGLDVTAIGEMDVSQKYGLSFKASSVRPAISSLSGLQRMLSGNLFYGIGPAAAANIVAALDNHFLQTITITPVQKLAKKCNISEKQAEILKAGIAQLNGEDMLLSLCPSLSPKQAMTLCSKLYFGAKAAEIIQKNPYHMLKVPGFTFKTADIVAIHDLGIDKTSLKRIPYLYYYALESYVSKYNTLYVNLSDSAEINRYFYQVCNTGCPEGSLSDIPHAQFTGFFSDQIVNRKVMMVPEDGEYRLYQAKLYIACQKIFDAVRAASHAMQTGTVYKRRSMRANVFLNQVGGSVLSNEQRAHVASACGQPVSILTGGPGTGKTRWIRSFADTWCYVNHSDIDHVFLMAPTGKAVYRIRESTGISDAETVARFLMMNDEVLSEIDSDLVNTHSQKITGRCCIIVDEASMLSIEDGAALISLIAGGHDVVFVGDIDQLMPVEPGSFLSELFLSGKVPCYRLTKNMRTSVTSLKDNFDRILNGDPHFQIVPSPDGSIPFFPVYMNSDTLSIEYAVREYMDYLKVGDVKDIVVLSPTRRGSAGTVGMNMALQSLINPKADKHVLRMDTDRNRSYTSTRGFEVPDMYVYGDSGASNLFRMRILDRLMMTKNHADMTWYRCEDDDPDLLKNEEEQGVFNGDTGVLLRYYPQTDTEHAAALIRLDDGRFVFLDDMYFKEIVPGYCLTIHKSQGTEYTKVVCLMPDSVPTFGTFLNRNLLYTAVTRAKSSVVLVGSQEKVAFCLRNKQVKSRCPLGEHMRDEIV